MTSARSSSKAEAELRPIQVFSCTLDPSPCPTVFLHPMLSDPEPAKDPPTSSSAGAQHLRGGAGCLMGESVSGGGEQPPPCSQRAMTADKPSDHI